MICARTPINVALETTTASGDTLSVTGDATATLAGTPLDDNGFDTSNFDSDFGTMTWDGDGGFVDRLPTG